MHKKEAYDLCRKYMHKYVLAETKDGHKVDGIIADVDEENVHMAVPNWGPGAENDMAEYRQYPYGFGYGYYPPYYPYYPSYPYYGFPYRRRFRRWIYPLAGLAALSLLPYY